MLMSEIAAEVLSSTTITTVIPENDAEAPYSGIYICANNGYGFFFAPTDMYGAKKFAEELNEALDLFSACGQSSAEHIYRRKMSNHRR